MSNKDIRGWFKEWKKTLDCVECGEDHHATLEFHHVEPAKKSFAISAAVRSAKNWEDIKRIRRELKKCISLCSNCHKKVHYDMRQKSR